MNFRKKNNQVSSAQSPESASAHPTKRANNGAKILIAVVLALVIFGGLLIAQYNALQLPPTSAVIMATADIPSNVLITDDNFSQYFTTADINTSALPANAITDKESVIGKVTSVGFATNEVATTNRFVDNSDVVSMTDAVEVSVSASSASYADGGRIRAGDRVNIGYIKTGDEGSQYVEILSNCYVTAAMDGSGVEAVGDGDGVVTTMFSIALSKEQANTLHSQVELGNIVLQKVD